MEFVRYTALICAIVLFALTSKAGEEKYTNFVNGADVTSGTIYETEDSKFYLIQNYPTWPNEFNNHSVKNRVVLEFDKNDPTEYTSDISADVQIYVEYIDENLVTHSETRTLTINYFVDPAQSIVDKSSFVFEGGHYVEVEILSVSQTGGTFTNMQLRTEIEIERYYTFDHTQSVSQLGYNYTTGDDEIELYWDHIEGAEEYDVEWVFINDYTTSTGNYESTNNLPYNYYKNSTRISTTSTDYKIPAIYDHGYVLFRVRGVSKQGANYNFDYLGEWSAQESGTVASHPIAQVVAVTSQYETGNKNWLHSVAYTEGGKRKEKVSFLDGLGRQRQSVTFNPVTDQSIVQNAYYDYHGRLAVTDLPTPVIDGELEFYPEFNLSSDNPTNEVFNASNFDLDYISPACPAIQDPMITSSGASKYYSSNNPDKNGAQAYVPDAEGYPFSRVQYTPDQTGRIRAISGYGEDFQIGSEHETKYFYSTPTVGEIDNLFGDEGGYRLRIVKH